MIQPSDIPFLSKLTEKNQSGVEFLIDVPFE